MAVPYCVKDSFRQCTQENLIKVTLWCEEKRQCRKEIVMEKIKKLELPME